MTNQEIFEELKPPLVEVLGVSPEKIRLDSVLVSDLGAESIDLLDLSFRIEEKFQVRIEANEIEREARKRLPGGAYEKDGYLTEAALDEIRKSLPELDANKLVKGLRKMDSSNNPSRDPSVKCLRAPGFSVHKPFARRGLWK